MPLADENRAVFCRWRRSAGWPFFDNSFGTVGRLGRRADSAPAPGLRRVPPARAFGWGFGASLRRASGACFWMGFRREPSDGVSVRAFGRVFGERCCPGFGRRGEKNPPPPLFDPIKRYFCREGCARAGIVCLFAGCRSAGMRRGVPRGTGLLRRRRGVPRGMGLLRRRRGGGVPRGASDLVRAAACPGAGPFRQNGKSSENGESSENGKSTENGEKRKIDRKQRIDGI